MTGLCRAAGFTRQAYHKGRKQRVAVMRDDERVLACVRAHRCAQPRLGTRKLKHELSLQGVEIGRDRLFALLRDCELLVPPKKKAVRTTYHDSSLPVYRNLLYGLEPTAPNHVWVSDITYIQTNEGVLYLSLITDLFSRYVVGWTVAESAEAHHTVAALQMALSELPADRWPIHHSDRGSQYCCHEYVAVLQSRGLPVSMTEQNHCYENCYAERVNGILKDEYHLDVRFKTRAQARRAIAQAIGTYNELRPHTSLGLRKPREVHQLAA